MSLQVKDVELAAQRLRDAIHPIPVTYSTTFSRMSGGEIYLKHENQQKTGSFKIRGAYNKIARLMETEKLQAVVASSAGNHAQGVAFAATSLGIKSTIVMPASAPIAKVSATEGYGAKVVLHGDCYDDAYNKACEIAETENAVFIHPYNDYDVMAGQATIGLEIIKDIPTVDMVIVPAGGGGLLAGVAFLLKSINPKIKVVGVQAEGAKAIYKSFKNKKLTTTDTVQTIADGIAVKIPGDKTVEIINEYVDEIVTVTDEEIASTILLLLERSKQVVEPAGATPLAAVINNKLDVAGKKVVCVLSGGNIDVSFIHKIVEKGLVGRGRQVRFNTVMVDTPGSLEKFARIVSTCGANIIMVQHDRLRADLKFNEAILHVVCEVAGFEHTKKLVSELESNGYKVILESTDD